MCDKRQRQWSPDKTAAEPCIHASALLVDRVTCSETMANGAANSIRCSVSSGDGVPFFVCLVFLLSILTVLTLSGTQHLVGWFEFIFRKYFYHGTEQKYRFILCRCQNNWPVVVNLLCSVTRSSRPRLWDTDGSAAVHRVWAKCLTHFKLAMLYSMECDWKVTLAKRGKDIFLSFPLPPTCCCQTLFCNYLHPSEALTFILAFQLRTFFLI